MSSVRVRKQAPSRRRHSRLRTFVAALQIIILIGLGASVGVGLALFVSLSKVLPNIGYMEAPEATIIYSSDNVVLGRIFREDRTNVPLKDIPKDLRDATVAIEDSRFYQHSGVDLRGIARAVWEDLRTGRPSAGGSTITQQLARNVYLSQRKTIDRKVQEAVLAILMERHFTKEKILELYLNRVYYGSGAFGVQAASKVYFGKDVDRLDLSECAMLAGMPKAPSGYSPHEDVKAAMDRRDVVLNRMAELHYISPEQAEAAKAEEITIVPRMSGRSTYKAPHFVDYVTRQLRQAYGDDVLYSGGLRVWTTLNYEMQKAAEDALRNGVKDFEKSRKVTEGCFVALEPSTGYIRAMVGSVDPASHFNRCTQSLRQPGSSFKVFVYSAAFEKLGMTPQNREYDGPKPFRGANGKVWSPKDYDGYRNRSMTIKEAVANSVNMVAIKVAEKVGIKNVIDYAQLMGITAHLDPYLSLAIGSSGVHPLEMASAYGTFANGGVHVESCAITKVTNSKGDTIQDYLPEGRRVISERTNAMIDECLRAVVTRGTGFRAGGVPGARGKTGTTNDDRDAWFIGYVPTKLVAACWIGNDNYAPMHRAYGGFVGAPIWKEFMLKAIPLYDKIHKDEDKAARNANAVKHTGTDSSDQNADQPEKKRRKADVTAADDSGTVTLRICDDSQLLATRHCPSTHLETFTRGSEPTSYCTIHTGKTGAPAQDNTQGADTGYQQLTTVTVCRDSGLLATKYCPHRITKRVPEDQVPTQECNIHSGKE